MYWNWRCLVCDGAVSGHWRGWLGGTAHECAETPTTCEFNDELTTYQIDWGKAHDSTHNDDGTLTGKYTLVPDTRLQAIADAWNYDDIGQGRYEFRQQWSELADLLDALGGTDNELD